MQQSLYLYRHLEYVQLLFTIFPIQRIRRRGAYEDGGEAFWYSARLSKMVTLWAGKLQLPFKPFGLGGLNSLGRVPRTDIGSWPRFGFGNWEFVAIVLCALLYPSIKSAWKGRESWNCCSLSRLKRNLKKKERIKSALCLLYLIIKSVWSGYFNFRITGWNCYLNSIEIEKFGNR